MYLCVKTKIKKNLFKKLPLINFYDKWHSFSVICQHTSMKKFQYFINYVQIDFLVNKIYILNLLFSNLIFDEYFKFSASTENSEKLKLHLQKYAEIFYRFIKLIFFWLKEDVFIESKVTQSVLCYHKHNTFSLAILILRKTLWKKTSARFLK